MDVAEGARIAPTRFRKPFPRRDGAFSSRWGLVPVVIYGVELVLGECPTELRWPENHSPGLGSPYPERVYDVCVCLVIGGHQPQANYDPENEGGGQPRAATGDPGHAQQHGRNHAVGQPGEHPRLDIFTQQEEGHGLYAYRGDHEATYTYPNPEARASVLVGKVGEYRQHRHVVHEVVAPLR